MVTKAKKICVLGMGYVGLPLILALSKHYDAIGFDINDKKISMLKQGKDPTGEMKDGELKKYEVEFTSDAKKIKECDFLIACVPTPVDKANNPDLSLVESVSKVIGENIKRGAVVVYESTVYPGVTEDICASIIEKYSDLKCGVDFKIGYSPERINPGDQIHALGAVTKIVSGMDKETLEIIDSVYSKITTTHRAPTIRVAEAAKVIENIQRDLNIALMNELQIIFNKMNIDINDVLKAAGTKWNFHHYTPGLVGGHCIPVDPYYLTYKAQEIGYHPQVILAGRLINDNMHKFYAEKIMKKLIEEGKKIPDSKVLILGLTFKPNVNDYRNSRVKYLIEELKGYGLKVYGHDPYLEDEVVKNEFKVDNVRLEDMKDKIDMAVLAVNHDCFNKITGEIKAKIFDIRTLKTSLK